MKLFNKIIQLLMLEFKAQLLFGKSFPEKHVHIDKSFLRTLSIKVRFIVQQPKAIYLANPVSSDKVFFSVDYISFGCI